MNILCIGAHTDDVELGMGGTVAKLVQSGHDVMVLALSHEYSGTGSLLEEFWAANKALGAQGRFREYTTRHFAEDRASILDDLIWIRGNLNPRVVYTHCSTDCHQDHRVVHEECIRAFKHHTLLGYELPWNNVQKPQLQKYEVLRHDQVGKKKEAIACYESQAGRIYTDSDYTEAHAIMRGAECGAYYAEAFEVIRWM